MLIESKDAKMRALGLFTKAEIKELRERHPDDLRGLDDSSITPQVVGWVAEKRARAQADFRRELPELKAQAKAAYDAEITRYLARNPNGKNAKKAGIRAARKIWHGFEA